MTLPSERVSLSRPGLGRYSSRRSRRGGVNVGIGSIDFHIYTACFGRRRILCGSFDQSVVPAVFELDWTGVVQR
jgi:hypothetical protein